MSSAALGAGIVTEADPPDWHLPLPDRTVCEVLRHEAVAAVAVHLPIARPPAPLEPLPFAGGSQDTDDT